MTIPNVTTTLDDDSFFVNLNGEDTSDHVSVFIDLDGKLNDAIGFTSERNQKIIRETSLQNWVYRLYNEKATGVPSPNFSDQNSILTFSYYLSQPFLHAIPNNIFGQFSYNYAKNYINQYNNYLPQPNSVNNFGADQDFSSGVITNTQLNIPPTENPLIPKFNYTNVNNTSKIVHMGNDGYIDEFSFILDDWKPSPSLNLNISNIIEDPTDNFAIGLTAGNQFADMGYKRWPFGPVSPWDTKWWAVYNFLEYGGQALIISPDILGSTGDNISNVIQKLKKSSLSFDSIVCLTNIDNEIARNIANTRKDCIAITTLDRSYTPDPVIPEIKGGTGFTTGPGPGRTLPPSPVGITSQFRFKVLDVKANNSDFGSSADFKYWLNNNYLDEWQYPSGSSNFNIETGGVTSSQIYGIGTGEVHLVTNYMPFKNINYGVAPIYLLLAGIEEPDKKAYGPGVDGCLRNNELVCEILEIPLGFTYEVPSQYTESITGDLATELPNAKVIIRKKLPLLTSFNAFASDIFYPASDVKIFGKEGESLEQSRLDIVNKTTVSFTDYLKEIVQGWSGSTAIDGYMGGITAPPGAPLYYFAWDSGVAKNNSNIWSRYFVDNINCPNMNWFDFMRPFTSPFIDVRKTFEKAHEQYFISANNRPTLDNLVFMPSDKDGRLSSDQIYKVILDFFLYNQAIIGTFTGYAFDPLIGADANQTVFLPWNINDFVWVYYGWPSNKFDAGYPSSTPTDQYIPDNLKNRYGAYHIEQNFLENIKTNVNLLNSVNIYGATLGTVPGEPGYLLTEFPEQLGKYWGCTCADLPQFFRDFFGMGRTYGGLPILDQEDGDLNINGYTPIDCIEFGPNETTGQVTAEGSTYSAFIAFRNPHHSLYMDYRHLDGSLFGTTSQEYPNFGIHDTTDTFGNSILWRGTTLTNTHPGHTRGGTMGSLYLPFSYAPYLQTTPTPIGGVRYGFFPLYLQYNSSLPLGQTLKFYSSLDTGGE